MPQDKCRILSIDDHEDSSEMLRLLLAHENYEVVTAISIDQAVRLATSEEFDLYVFDKNLPDGNGLELCKKLNEVTPGVPCIVYSGDAYDIHRTEALAAGADAYVAKPDIDALIQNVHELLAQRECPAAATA